MQTKASEIFRGWNWIKIFSRKPKGGSHPESKWMRKLSTHFSLVALQHSVIKWSGTVEKLTEKAQNLEMENMMNGTRKESLENWAKQLKEKIDEVERLMMDIEHFYFYKETLGFLNISIFWFKNPTLFNIWFKRRWPWFLGSSSYLGLSSFLGMSSFLMLS